MTRNSTRPFAAATLAALATLAMLSSVQVLFADPAQTAQPAAVYGSGDTDTPATQVVVIQGKRIARS